MTKKVFTLTSIIISCFILFGCGKESKNSSSGIIGKTITLKTYDGTGINCWDSEANARLVVPEGHEIQITAINYDLCSFQAVTKIDNENRNFECDFSALLYPYEILLSVIPDAAEGKPYATTILRNSDSNITNDQALTLYNAFLKKLPSDFFENFDDTDGKNDIQASSLYLILNLTYHGGEPSEAKITTPFHLAAEKANEQLANQILTNYYYLNSFDEDGRTPLIRAILKENLGACKAFYKKPYALSMAKDKNGKNFVDYSKESSNKAIKDLFSVFEISPEKLIQSYIPVLTEMQMIENFNAIDLKTYEVPYTVWNRAASKNLTINANSKSSFLSELAVQEEMLLLAELEGDVDAEVEEKNEESNSEDSRELPEIKLPTNIAFVFSRNDDGSVDYETKLKLRDKPSREGNETGILNYGTKVTILEKSEEAEIIGNVSDFWYKVKSDKAEGWCFGGFLAVAMQNSNYAIDNKDKIYYWTTQLKFEKGAYAIVGIDSVITDVNGNTYPVEPAEELEIIKEVPNQAYIDSDNKIDLYAFDPDSDHNSGAGVFIQYPYYIVRDKKNNMGVISGTNLVHRVITDDKLEPLSFFASFCTSENYHSYFAQLYEFNTNTKKSRKYKCIEDFSAECKPSVFSLGFSPRTGEYDYPYLNIYDAVDVTATIGPAEGWKANVKIICFYSPCYGEMGEEETYYQIYSITDRVIVKSFTCRGYSWNSRESDAFGNCSLYLYKDENNNVIAEKAESHRWYEMDGAIEGSHHEYYTWSDMTFYKTGEEDTDYIDER